MSKQWELRVSEPRRHPGQAALPSCNVVQHVDVLCGPLCLFPSLTSTTRSSSDALQGRYAAPELEVSSSPFLVLLYLRRPIFPERLFMFILHLYWSAFLNPKNTNFVQYVSCIDYGIKIFDFPPTKWASCVASYRPPPTRVLSGFVLFKVECVYVCV